MRNYLGIELEGIEARVKLYTGRNVNLHAFGELWLYQKHEYEEPIFKIKGWTIRTKEFGAQQVLTVVPPAYPTSRNYLTAFFINDKVLWKKVVDMFLYEYDQETKKLDSEIFGPTKDDEEVITTTPTTDDDQSDNNNSNSGGKLFD